MPAVTIDLDQAGWFPGACSVTTSPLAASPLCGAMRWENITSDEMVIGSVTYAPVLPWGDVSSVRERFRERLVPLRAALITCDLVQDASVPAIRCIAKYRPEQGEAMSYVAAIVVAIGANVLELSVRAVERGFTGVREALVTQELFATAGISEMEQLAKNIIPIEWKFERYRPGSRGNVAYLLSDDERYDQQFPEHPLSRVRRALRRVERTFHLAIADTALPDVKVIIRQPEVRPMAADEMVRELGRYVFQDAVLMEASRASRVGDVPLATRQKQVDDQLTAAIKEQVEKSKNRRGVRRVTSNPWTRDQAAQALGDVYDSVWSRCAGSVDPRLRELAAAALVNKARTMVALQQHEAANSALETLERQVGASLTPELKREVADLLNTTPLQTLRRSRDT